MSKKNFKSTMRKGFRMTFENGYTVSIQWGAGNYCDNHFPEDKDFSFSKDAVSDTAEAAVISPSRNLVDPANFIQCFTDGEVAGWLTPEEVAELIYKVSTWPR